MEEQRVKRKRIGAEKRKKLLDELSVKRAKAVKMQEEDVRAEQEKATARERRLDLAAMQRVKLLEELHRMDWEMTELLEEGSGKRRECGDRNWGLMVGNKMGGRKRFARKTGRWSGVAKIWAGRKGVPRRKWRNAGRRLKLVVDNEVEMTDWWGEDILHEATPTNMDCDIVSSLEKLSLDGEVAKQWEVFEFSWLLNAGQVNHIKGGDIQNHEKNNGDGERKSNFDVGEESWEHEWLDDLVLCLDSLDIGQAEKLTDQEDYEEVLSTVPSNIDRDWLKIMVRDIRSVPEMVVIVDKSTTEIDTNIVSYYSGDELETVAVDMLDGERDLNSMLQEQSMNITLDKPKEQALEGEIKINELFVGTCSQPSVARDNGGGGVVMKQVQDMSGQVARLEVKSKSGYGQKEWLPPEPMITGEECLVRIEVDRLNNLSKGLEETDQYPRKRKIGDEIARRMKPFKKGSEEQELGAKTIRRVVVPGRGRTKQRRMEGSMVVRSLDSFVVRVMSPAKRDNEGLVGTEDESSKKQNISIEER